MFRHVRDDQIWIQLKNLFTTWQSCKEVKTLSVKRSWLLLAGHPFFLVILCQCTLKNCEHGGGWERTEKKNITQCKYKKMWRWKESNKFLFRKENGGVSHDHFVQTKNHGKQHLAVLLGFRHCWLRHVYFVRGYLLILFLSL